MLNFTADQARALPGASAHAHELEKNARHLRGVASIEDSREVTHHRKVGVLVYATNEAAMAADLRAAGFTVTPATTPGFLRAHW